MLFYLGLGFGTFYTIAIMVNTLILVHPSSYDLNLSRSEVQDIGSFLC